MIQFGWFQMALLGSKRLNRTTKYIKGTKTNSGFISGYSKVIYDSTSQLGYWTKVNKAALHKTRLQEITFDYLTATHEITPD